MASEKRRLMWLDILKGLCMFFIVMSHSAPPEAYVRFYTPFFLSAFFFSSGYTFSGKENVKSFIVHKIRTILIPYWCFGIINALLAWIADGDRLSDRLIGLLLSINRKNDDLWFIACLFVMQVLFYIVWRLLLSRENKQTIGACLITVLMMVVGYALIQFGIAPFPFQLETALIMMPFMLGGYVYRHEFNAKKLSGGGTAICLLAYLLLVLLYRNVVNIHAESYPNFAIFACSAVLGVSMIVGVSQWIENMFPESQVTRAVIFVGENTFVYYALQSKAIRLLDVIYSKLSVSLSDYVRNLIYAIIVCGLLAVVAVVINKWFPFLLGRSYKRGK